MTREEAIKVMENVKSIFVTEYYKNRFQEAVNSLSCPIVKNYKDKKPEEGVEVIAFNKAWIDKDFNPNGTRIGFLLDDGFISATWDDEQYFYDTCYKEGDDYYKGISGIRGADEYHKQFAKPDMPTHWMKMPTHP